MKKNIMNHPPFIFVPTQFLDHFTWFLFKKGRCQASYGLWTPRMVTPLSPGWAKWAPSWARTEPLWRPPSLRASRPRWATSAPDVAKIGGGPLLKDEKALKDPFFFLLGIFFGISNIKRKLIVLLHLLFCLLLGFRFIIKEACETANATCWTR